MKLIQNSPQADMYNRCVPKWNTSYPACVESKLYSEMRSFPCQYLDVVFYWSCDQNLSQVCFMRPEMVCQRVRNEGGDHSIVCIVDRFPSAVVKDSQLPRYFVMSSNFILSAQWNVVEKMTELLWKSGNIWPNNKFMRLWIWPNICLVVLSELDSFWYDWRQSTYPNILRVHTQSKTTKCLYF